MTTINTIDDFLQALDDNPSWREAVRVRILGEDILQMPAKFDAFVEEQRTFNQEMRAFNEEQRAINEEQRTFNQEIRDATQELRDATQELRAFNEEQRTFNQEIRDATQELRDATQELRAFNEEQRTFNQEMRDATQELRAFNEEQKTFNEELRAINEEQKTFNEELRAINEEQKAFNQEQRVWSRNATARFGRMEGDISTFKHLYVNRQPFSDAPGIAGDFGLEFVRILNSEDLSSMAGSSLPRDLHTSFRNADLIIECAGETGLSYIVIEVSYTADTRDTDRAIRNAELITRFTGRPAQPVIASIRNDYKVEELIESGAVHWYEVRDHAGRDADFDMMAPQ